MGEDGMSAMHGEFDELLWQVYCAFMRERRREGLGADEHLSWHAFRAHEQVLELVRAEYQKYQQIISQQLEREPQPAVQQQLYKYTRVVLPETEARISNAKRRCDQSSC